VLQPTRFLDLDLDFEQEDEDEDEDEDVNSIVKNQPSVHVEVPDVHLVDVPPMENSS
jgi:hypothetical protein